MRCEDQKLCSRPALDVALPSLEAKVRHETDGSGLALGGYTLEMTLENRRHWPVQIGSYKWLRRIDGLVFLGFDWPVATMGLDCASARSPVI